MEDPSLDKSRCCNYQLLWLLIPFQALAWACLLRYMNTEVHLTYHTSLFSLIANFIIVNFTAFLSRRRFEKGISARVSKIKMKIIKGYFAYLLFIYN